MQKWLLIIGWLIAVWPAHQVYAQAIQLALEEVTLAEALTTLSQQARVDVVYAERQVKDQTTTCHYTGNDANAALHCLLQHTGLRAERIRRRQYVLASAQTEAQFSTQRPSPKAMLRGFITDRESGEVLPGAHVYLPNLQLGTTTNEAGYFALSSLPIQPFALRFSYLGYATKDTTLVPGHSILGVPLTAIALEANEVVVEATRSDGALNAVPGMVNLPMQDLERLPSFPGETDLFQALQWLPGIRKSGQVNGGLIVRGGAEDQNLYLLDGAPVYHPWHAFSLVSTFQTETFKGIKLYQGSFPAEHGGRLASVMEAELRDGSRAQPRALAAVGLLSARFIIESPINDYASFMVSGRRSYLDKLIGREHPVEENGQRDTLRTGYFFYDLSAKVTARPSYRHRFSLSYYGGKDLLDVRLPFDLSLNFSDWLRPADLFFEVDQNWGNQLVSARYQYLYSRRLFLTTTAYRSGYRANESFLLHPTAASTVLSDYRIRIRDLGLKVALDYYPSLAHQVRAGVQVVERGFKSFLDATIQRSLGTVDSLDQAGRARSVELVAFLQDSWQPTPRWQIQPGLRLSYFSGAPRAWVTPRLSLRYALDDRHLVFRAAAGLQVQYMHRIRDRFSYLYDLVSSRWIPASEAVRPSYSFQLAGGIESAPVPWLTLTADGYWRHSDRILLPRDEFQTKNGLEGPGIDVGTLLGQYTPGKAQAFGLETTARLRRGPWQVLISYAGGRSLSRAPGLDESSYRPTRFDVPRTLRTVATRTGTHWAFSLSSEWRSGYPITIPEARYAIADPLDPTPIRYLYRPSVNNGRLPPYLRLDATVGYRFRLIGARFKTQMHLFNLTNRRNIVDRLYDPRQEGPVFIKDRRGLPLLPLFELQMEL